MHKVKTCFPSQKHIENCLRGFGFSVIHLVSFRLPKGALVVWQKQRRRHNLAAQFPSKAPVFCENTFNPLSERLLSTWTELVDGGLEAYNSRF